MGAQEHDHLGGPGLLMWMDPAEFEKRCQAMREKYRIIAERQKDRDLKAQAKAAQAKLPKKRTSWNSRRYLDLPPGPPTAKPRPLSNQALFKGRSLDSLRAEATRLANELYQAEELAFLLRQALRRVDKAIQHQERFQAKPRRRPAAQVSYPEGCPRCRDSRVIRAGFSKARKQMFRCKACNSSWVHEALLEGRKDFKLICHRCKGTNTENRGPANRLHDGSSGGRQAYCFDCDKGFIQGGAHHLRQHGEKLRERIAQATLRPDVQAEVFQTAALAILEGQGYWDTIPLNLPGAFREVLGEYRQAGSDHPEFRRQQGQRPYDD